MLWLIKLILMQQHRDKLQKPKTPDQLKSALKATEVSNLTSTK